MTDQWRIEKLDKGVDINYKSGLRNGSHPAGSRGRAPVGLWGEAERFLEFKLNIVHVIQKNKLKVGLFLELKLQR